MTRTELLDALEAARELAASDAEVAHYEADNALIAFINDADVTTAYHAITPKWYA